MSRPSGENQENWEFRLAKIKCFTEFKSIRISTESFRCDVLCHGGKGEPEFFAVGKGGGAEKMTKGHHKQTTPLLAKNELPKWFFVFSVKKHLKCTLKDKLL